MHPDGYVKIKDRSQGHHHLRRREHLLASKWRTCCTAIPAVLAAAVVAQPDAKWGETPCAFVELKAGRDASAEDELIAHCRAHLARFKVPKRVVFGELPKTSTGKIQKFVLRERAQIDRGHRVRRRQHVE